MGRLAGYFRALHIDKKADVVERPMAFTHVGLLVNEPPGTAGLLFVLSSDNFVVKAATYSPARLSHHENLKPLSREGNGPFSLLPHMMSEILVVPEAVRKGRHGPAMTSSHPYFGRSALRASSRSSDIMGVCRLGIPLVSEGLGRRGVAMRTVGELEAAICEGMTRFEQDYMGRGPKNIHTYLLGDLLVVRLQGVLTAAEQQLVKSLSADKGRDLLKQVRTHLVETARPVLEAMVQEVTGVKVLSLHHDISTFTGEEVVLFTLAESPDVLDAKKK